MSTTHIVTPAGMSLADLVAALTVLAGPALDVLPHIGSSGIGIQSVTADSRQVAAGALFVAVPGASHDGHDYLAQAVGSGAVAALGAKSRAMLAEQGVRLPDGFPYLQVSNARRALAEASAALYGFPGRDMVVIGVTGTDGKTTTCTLLESILTRGHAFARRSQGTRGRDHDGGGAHPRRRAGDGSTCDDAGCAGGAAILGADARRWLCLRCRGKHQPRLGAGSRGGCGV